jgi:hypothetical protein
MIKTLYLETAPITIKPAKAEKSKKKSSTHKKEATK